MATFDDSSNANSNSNSPVPAYGYINLYYVNGEGEAKPVPTKITLYENNRTHKAMVDHIRGGGEITLRAEIKPVDAPSEITFG